MTFCNARVHLRVAASVIVSACVVTGAWDVTVAAGPQSPPPAPLASAAAVHRAVLDRYCVTCHNARAENRGPDARRDGPRAGAGTTPRCGRRSSGSCAPARCRRRARRGPTRPRRRRSSAWLETTIDRGQRGAAESGTPGAASAQSRRIPERHPRSARARRRRRGAAAAPTIRATASTTSPTCSASRRCCSSATWARPRRSARWRSAIRRMPPTDDDVSRALRSDADAPHRRPAARHPRRHARFARRSRSTASTSSSRSSGAPTSASSAASRIRTRSRSRSTAQRVHLVTVGTPEDFATSLMGPQNAVTIIEERMQVRVPIKAGPRTIGVAFVEKTGSDVADAAAAVPVDARPGRLRGRAAARGRDDQRSLRGRPVRATRRAAAASSAAGPRRVERRARVEGAVARRATTPPARRRFSRRSRAARTVAPSATPTCGRCSPSTRRAARRGTSTPASSSRVERMLADPQFVFRVERDPPTLAPGAAFRVSDLELASRLSFFLWSSIPDEPAAGAGQPRASCSDPAVLEQQVRRMLRDPRAEALVSNFAGQWLYLRNLKNVVPEQGPVSRLRRQPAPGVSARNRDCSSRASCARTAACSIC